MNAGLVLSRADQTIVKTQVAGSFVITESRWHGWPLNGRYLHVFNVARFDETEKTFEESELVAALEYHSRLTIEARQGKETS